MSNGIFVYYIATKKNKLLIHVTMWINYTDILSERNNIQKNIYM